jgi:hypothetical protein
MNSTTSRTLAKDPGCLHALQMIPRFIGLDLRMAKRKLQLKLGLSKLIELVPEVYRIPDSKLAHEATALVREISDDMLLNHCYRTYLFGCILAHQDGLKFDKEVFYLASIMHDIGLSEKHEADPGSFEYVGARVAHQFCLSHDYDKEKSALVHDAIALHSSVGLAHKEDPEIALVHFGAGVDVIGIHYDEIPKYALTEILEQYPRLDYKNTFLALLDKQVVLKPDSHISTHMRLGFSKKVRQTPFAE